MNLVEQKNDDNIYIDPLLVISRLAQLSVYPFGTIIHIVDNIPKLVNIEIKQYTVNDIIFTFDQLWESILEYTDWYKTLLVEKYKPDYITLTIRAIQGIQKMRDLAGSRVAIEAMLSRVIVLLADSCGVEVPGGITSKRSPYVGSLFGNNVMSNLVLVESAYPSSIPGVSRKSHIKRIDFKPLISLLTQYDSKITESEEELTFIREAIDSWISSQFHCDTHSHLP